MGSVDVKKLFLFLAVISLFSSGMVSTAPAFADNDDDDEGDDKKKGKKTKTLESECAKKKPNSFDGLFCVSIFNLQSTIDSFFDIFVELEDTANLECPDGQYAIGTGVNGELICAPLQIDLPLQTCPPGKVMIGIESDGTIVCDDIIPSCSGHGTFDFNLNICVCDSGYEGADCSVETPQTNQCTSQEVNQVQSCTLLCDGDLTCISDCASSISSQCSSAINQLSLCALSNGCIDFDNPLSIYSSCTFQQCPAEWENVFGDEGFTCPLGTTNCGGGCVDTLSDTFHCGACNNSCPSYPNTVPICSGAACSTECLAGFADVDGDPFNGCETPISNQCVVDQDCGPGMICLSGGVQGSGTFCAPEGTLPPP